MSTTVASSRIVLLLLLVGFLAGIAYGQLYQRRVCPPARRYKPARLCRKVPDRCASDEECTGGAERCCPTDNECYLSCQKTVIPSGCPIPIDLALLLDSSGSIGRRNWRKVQKFAKDVVDIYDISEKGTHIAIMPYSTKPVIEIKFNKYKGVKLNGVSIKRDIDGFRLQRGLTYIDRALAKADKELFTEAAGMRKNIRKVALVLTDGIQTKDRDPFTKLEVASRPLKKKGISIYSLGVGSDIDVLELIQTASSDEFVFSARNFDDLSRKVTEITDKQCKACTKNQDIVFGIPDSTSLAKPYFDGIKGFFSKLSTLFTLESTKTHYGIVRYSDTASMELPLDQIYQQRLIQDFIKDMGQRGNGVDVNKAIRVAADHAFTMYGGVRQTIPKTFVIFVPEKESVGRDTIELATKKLKSMGVRVLFVGLQDKIDINFYKGISSQPSSRYFLTGYDLKELTNVASFEAFDTICKGRYGKCPILEPPAECPAGEPDSECKIDSDCNGGDDAGGDAGLGGGDDDDDDLFQLLGLGSPKEKPVPDTMCCYDKCGGSKCVKRIKNCFITMDVAFAIDSSAGVSDSDFQRVKAFAKNLVHNFADSENAIHFGLVQYAGTAQSVVDFNKFLSDPKIKPVIDGLSKSSDNGRRVDLALETVKKDVFSLEGGMRQGHPRFVIFITGGDTDPGSKNLAQESAALRGLNVNIIAVGINSGVSTAFLGSLATDPKYVYSANSSNDLANIREKMEQQMCPGKPGQCPPVHPSAQYMVSYGCHDSDNPNDIPCGASKPGPAPEKTHDWDCPGEMKCCLQDNGCAFCKKPLNAGCGNLTCFNGGTKYCGSVGHSSQKVAKCRCTSRRTGKQCERYKCPSIACYNGGRKYCSKGIAYCRCEPGYYGKNCQNSYKITAL